VERVNKKAIARERIRILLESAVGIASENYEIAERQAEIARRIKEKSRVEFEPDQKLLFCKKCKRFIVPGITSIIRVQRVAKKRSVLVKCLRCGQLYRRVLEKVEVFGVRGDASRHPASLSEQV